MAGSAVHHAPSEFPPPVDSVKEFVKRGLDGEDERIDVGAALFAAREHRRLLGLGAQLE